jgi:hypothetical protein
VFGWFPPLAAAEVALEQLRIVLIKHQDSTHAFIVPHLLTSRWLKQLWKACDIVLTLPVGAGVGWPTNMYEPVLMGICFPYLRFKPWQFRGVPKMFQVAQDLCCLLKEDGVDAGPFLCKFWKDCHRMHALLEDVVSRMLYFVPNSDIPHCAEGGRSNRPHGLQ